MVGSFSQNPRASIASLMKCLASIVLACLASASLAAAQTTSDNVDHNVEAEMARQHIPGLALGVYREGEIVKVQGYGLANVELSVPVKPETVFQSGSIGKQFAATAVMMLVEEHKIDLDDSIRKYFTDAPASWNNIKIGNLLSHTSGLSEYESDEKIKPGGPINLRADYTENQLVKIIESFPLDFQPGKKWAYRNTNYLLLGVVIHKVTGEFYGDFLQERIFQPLGMTSTRVISEADIVPNRAAGYQLVRGALKNQDWVSPSLNTMADGALYFNIRRSRQMGRRAIHGKTAEKVQPRPDVVGGQALERQAQRRELWFRMGDRSSSWASGLRARRLMARFHRLYSPLRRR